MLDARHALQILPPLPETCVPMVVALFDGYVPGPVRDHARCGRSRPAVGLLRRSAGQHQVVVARPAQAGGATVSELLDTCVDAHAQAVWQHREPEQRERPEPDSAGTARLQPGPDEDLVELAQPVCRDRGARGRSADPRRYESPLGAGAEAIECRAVPRIEQQAEPAAVAGVQQQVTAWPQDTGHLVGRNL